MKPALVLESVTKIYGEGEGRVRAVVDASLEVERGTIVLIMGPSGAGKTTLLSMIGGLLSPTSGRIWLGETEITALPERDLPALRLSRVGFVFQGFNLLSDLTVVENVRIVMEAARRPYDEAEARARAILGRLGMEGRLHRFPDDLSGGEKQRVAIARAVANEADLVLADEPTGNLDSKTGYRVMQMLEAFARENDKTVVCVTHDTRIVDVADRVLWLEDGLLSERPREERRAAPARGLRSDSDGLFGHIRKKMRRRH